MRRTVDNLGRRPLSASETHEDAEAARGRAAAERPVTAVARLRLLTPLALALALLLGAVALAVAVGSVTIAPGEALRILLARLPLPLDWAGAPASLAHQRILLDIRLPRVALIGLAGAALAGSGAAYQGLFRNPLADPYLIGVAAGAGLGAIGVMTLQAGGALLTSPLAVPAGAFLGAVVAVGLVYRIGISGGDSTRFVLAGVAIAAIASAISTFLMLRGGQQVARVLVFLLGGYGGAGWSAVYSVAPFALLGVAVLHLFARPLNLLLFDEDQARRLGVDVERVRLVVVLAATLATAAAVAFAGLIGFVGLIVPHTVRLLVGADHRRVMPLATVGGAAFLILADLLARTVIAPQELPLGVVTALAGAPFFLYLLRRR